VNQGGDGPSEGVRSADRERFFSFSSFGAWALALTALHIVLGLLLYEPALFPGGDNADYMILGEALRTGEGYRDLHLPGAPLHAKYPPGYPALLAVLGLVGGVQWFKISSLLLGALSVWTLAHLGRTATKEGVALGAGALLAVSPVLLEYSHYVLSEASFTALVLLSLYFASCRRESESPRDFIWALVFGVAAFLTRTAGLALLVALPLAELGQRRGRRAAIAAVVGVSVAALWGVFQRAAAPGRPGYLSELLLVNPYDPAAGRTGVAELATRTASNAWTYVSRVLPESLTGSTGPDASALATVLGIVVSGIALSGWVARAREEVRTPEIFAVTYSALIVVWPTVWTDRRFLLPLLPLVLLYAVQGADRLGARLSERRAWLATTGLVALLAVIGMRSIFGLVPQRRDCLASFRAGSPCDPPALASFYAAARWTGENTPPDAVVANRKPSLFFWFSRRRGDLYPYSSEPELVLGGLEEMRADYVVVDQVSATTLRYLVPAVQQHPDRFTVVYQAGDPATLVLRFDRRPRTALRFEP
jgi:hypothetical protein